MPPKKPKQARFDLPPVQDRPAPRPARKNGGDSDPKPPSTIPRSGSADTDMYPVHPENYLDGVRECTMYDLVMVDIPAPPIFGRAMTVSKSTRDPTEADIDIQRGDSSLQVIVQAQDLARQYFPATKALLKRIIIKDLTTVEDYDIAAQICPSLTKRGSPPVMHSEKDTERLNRDMFDNPANYILRYLLTHNDSNGMPFTSSTVDLTEFEQNITLPYVSSAPGAYFDPSGVSRQIIPDSIHVLRLLDHPKDPHQGQTYPKAFVVREDKTHHVIHHQKDLDPLREFRVDRKHISALWKRDDDDDSVPGLRFVSPVTITEGRKMDAGAKMLLQVSALSPACRLSRTDLLSKRSTHRAESTVPSSISWGHSSRLRLSTKTSRTTLVISHLRTGKECRLYWRMCLGSLRPPADSRICFPPFLLYPRWIHPGGRGR